MNEEVDTHSSVEVGGGDDTHSHAGKLVDRLGGIGRKMC